MYISPTQFPELWQLAKIAGYNGKHLEASQFHENMQLNSYWSGGERDDWIFIQLDTKATKTVEQNGTPFDGLNYKLSKLPQGICLVRVHTGRYNHCNIHFNTEDITKLLPAQSVELSQNEKIVLNFTAAYKSSYAGRKDNRFYEANHYTKIQESDWKLAKESLIAKKLLNKAGAITVEGRNAREQNKVNTN